MKPLISIVICTRNRAHFLREAIVSALAQDVPSRAYEIIVVDNGSTDATANTVEQFRSQGVRLLREESIGLCVARNTGWQAAEGQYVLFFDDDAIAAPGWLAAALDTFEGCPLSIGVLGGPVKPLWEIAPPAWLEEPIARSLTIIDWGNSAKVLPDLRGEWLVGANMAVPKALLDEVGGFHPWLDRVGDNLLSSGDVFLQRRVIERGYVCFYVPSMSIYHRVPSSRVNQLWFEKRFYWQGISDAVMHLIEHTPAWHERVFLAASVLKGIVASRQKVVSLLVRRRQAEAFTWRCLTLIEIGFVAGMLGAAGH